MVRRRRNKETLIETLLKASWKVSFVVAIVMLIALKIVIPGVLSSSAILKPLASLISSMAWLFSGVFLFIGVMSFIREKSSASGAKPEASWGQGSSTTKVDSDRCNHLMGKQHNVQNLLWPKEDRVIEAWEASIAKDSQNPKPSEWSIELLRDLEWKRFEDVCQKLYEYKGIKSETTPLGPDGGIDIRLFQDESGQATAIVQCKAWGNRNVGVKPVRELLGVMSHEEIAKAFFMTPGSFTDEAKTFAQSNNITLVTGEMILTMIQRLPEEAQKKLLALATDGDFRTPTCPSCGIKMRQVAGSNGRPDFWGCPNYPRCRQNLYIRKHLSH